MIRSINEFMRKYMPGAYEKKMRGKEWREGFRYRKKRRDREW